MGPVCRLWARINLQFLTSSLQILPNWSADRQAGGPFGAWHENMADEAQKRLFEDKKGALEGLGGERSQFLMEDKYQDAGDPNMHKRVGLD